MTSEISIGDRWHTAFIKNRLASQRKGQAMMNALHDVDPEYHATLVGTPMDVFDVPDENMTPAGFSAWLYKVYTEGGWE